MDYNIQEKNGATEVAMQGRFTFADSVAFNQIVEKLKALGGKKVVLDMTGIEFIDSAALGMLLLARDTAATHHTELSLRAPQGQVKRMLAVVKFDTIFAIHP